MSNWRAATGGLTLHGQLPDNYRPPRDALTVFARILSRLLQEDGASMPSASWSREAS